MKKRIFIVIFSVVLLIFLSPFLASKVARISNDIKMTSAVDYIEISSTGKKIYIKSIKTIEPTIWKGSYDGILHYKNGSTAEIDISYYGDFFGIKGEERGLFSKGVLYKYETEIERTVTNDDNGYKTELLYEKDYLGTRLEQWIKRCNKSNGYYEFINSDPDSWDMYIFYPDVNSELKYITYNTDIEIKDGIIKINFEEASALSDDQVSKNLVLHVKAPMRGAWPTKSEVYLNGEDVDCLNRDFQE